MGHIRLGTLPDTAPWRQVIRLIAEDADVATIAQATTEAALAGLQKSRDDDGLAFTFWILSQTVLAAREADFAATLGRLNIIVPEQPGVFDIIAGVTHAIDQRLHQTRGRTDIGEMAELSAVEALTALLGQRSASLYGTTPAEVHTAAHELSLAGPFRKSCKGNTRLRW